MALKWESKILLVKLEDTYGTEATPLGLNGILAKDIQLTPMDGNDVDRELERPFFGAQGTIPTELHSKINFQVELVGSGTAGNAPQWGPVLRACGMAEVIVAGTSVTYNPISDAQESATIYMFIERTLFALVGTRGTVTLEFTASGIPYLNFALTGLFVQPREENRIQPTLTGFQKPQVASKANTPTFTVNSVPLVVRSFSLNLSNDVEPRFLMNSEEIIITDRNPAIETTVEAVPLTTMDPYALALAQAEVPVSLVHGKTAGKIATLTVPNAQMQRPQGLQNAQKILEWPLRLVPLPTIGNDEFTLALT